MDALQKLLGPDFDTVLAELGIMNVPEADREEVVTGLVNHFSDIMMETVVVNLNNEQLDEFKAALALEPDARDEKIAQITALVPGLAQKIESSVMDEIAVLKAARAQLN